MYRFVELLHLYRQGGTYSTAFRFYQYAAFHL